MNFRSPLVLLVSIGVLVAAPTAAEAANTRYASPAGAGGTCSSAQPCALLTAIIGAGTGDEVILAPGTYTAITSMNFAGLNVHGAAGQPRPLIQSSQSPTFALGGTDSKLADVRIAHTTVNDSVAVSAGGTSEISRIEVSSQGTACAISDFAVIRDSICDGGPDPSDTGLRALLGSSGGPKARNVTAVGYLGVVGGTQGAGTVVASVDLRNVIAQGTGSFDLNAENNGAIGSTTTVAAQTSNFDQVATAGIGETLPGPGSGTNQTAVPVFVNGAGGDFHQAAGSPTIDAGSADPSNGTTDFELEPRIQGAMVDIGADEFTPAVGPPADTTPPETTISKGPKKKTKSKKATFTFVSGEGGSTFTCALDKKPATPCTSPLQLKRLKKGKHKLTVTAVDAAGNADPTPAVYAWKVKKPKRK